MRRFGNMGLLASFAVFLGLSQAAFAQQEMNLRSKGMRPYTIELKTLPVNTLNGDTQGSAGSVGLGTEIFMNEKLSWFVDGLYTNKNLPTSWTGNSDKYAVIDKQDGWLAQTGIRWYSSPALSSWYAQGGAGYSDASGKYKYKGDYVSTHVISVLGSAEAGYRWLFKNNMLFRIGVGAMNDNFVSRSATADYYSLTSNDAEAKVSSVIKTPWVTTADLGLGYAF